MKKTIEYQILIILLIVFSQNATAQLLQDNYYCESNDEIFGLSFYNGKHFRYYHKTDIVDNKKHPYKYFIEKGIGTYKVDTSILYLKYASYNPKSKKQIKVDSIMNNGKISYVDTFPNTQYIENKLMKYEILSIKNDSLILKKAELPNSNNPKLAFVVSNKRIEDLCKELNIIITPMKDLMKMGYMYVYKSSPKFIGEFKDFNKYFRKYFPYVYYYDDRGVFIIKFLIETDGTIKNIYIQQSRDEEFTMEAIKLIKSTSKKWKPAFKNGKKVNYIMTLRGSGYPTCGGGDFYIYN